ncbi:MAG: hypothetical protein IJ339_00320 [Oscillospiraceae bacterium]|nr:hypothetical protein [Oscillospiraceae bacterium]
MTEFKTQELPKENRHCLQFETDNRDYFLRVQTAAEECIDHKPLTNFERIKAMTVEEIAVFFAKAKADLERTYRQVIAYKVADVNENIEWLESEVQEDDR